MVDPASSLKRPFSGLLSLTAFVLLGLRTTLAQEPVRAPPKRSAVRAPRERPAAAAQEPVRAPPKPPVGSETPPAAPAHEEVLEIDRASGRETVPAALLEKLRFAAPTGDGTPATERTPDSLLVGEKSIPLADLLFLRFPWGGAQPLSAKVGGVETTFRLFLRSGDEILGVIAGGDDDRILFKSAALGDTPYALPLAAVKGLLVVESERSEASGRPGWRRAGWRWAEGAEGGTWGRLREKILSLEAEEDQFLLREGGQILGLLETVRERAVRVSSEKLGDVEVPYDKLRAFILARSDLDGKAKDGEERKKAPAGAGSGTKEAQGGVPVRLALRDGSVLLAAAGALESGKLSVKHQTLGPLMLSLGDVFEIGFLSSRARYLSDLTPAETRESLGAAFVLKKPFRRDTNVLGGPLRLGTRLYQKGLGVHAYSLLEYNLGSEYSRFQATIGLDASAHPTDAETAATDVGSVVFRVRLDKRTLLEKALTWRDEPVSIDLSIAGGAILGLEVDYGGTPGSMNCALDRADWADARVIR